MIEIQKGTPSEVLEMLLFDAFRCTGCRICENVCSVANEGELNPRKSRISVIKAERVGFDSPMACLQCETPLCKEACPMNAIVRDVKTSALTIVEERCIGCKMCVVACPFGGITVLPDKKVAKCDLCGGDPKCVQYCPTGAIEYIPERNLALRKRREALRRLSRLHAMVGGPG